MRREGFAPTAGLWALLCLATRCNSGSQGGGGGGLEPPATHSAKARAGEALFRDTSLSASGRQSCATCHVPERLFSADPLIDQGLPVPLGRRDMDPPGFRKAPSLVYAAITSADGSADLYQYNDDLPVAFDGNVNVGEIPYTAPRTAGGQSPTLDAQEIDYLVAFLCTLTDGYDPKNPAACDLPAQCLPGAL